MPVHIPQCEPGKRQVVVKNHPGRRDQYMGEGVQYCVRETVTGEHVHIAIAASWRRYDNAYRSPEEEAERTRARAHRKLRERVMTLGADRMLTLTYRENLQDFELSRVHFRKFVLAMRKTFPKFKFVAAAEQQERGAYHWHIAILGNYDVRMIRAIWLKVIAPAGWDRERDPSPGNVDITSPRRSGGATKIADYISKYLGKGFDVDGKVRYQHYYCTSRGLCAVSYGYHLIGFTHFELQDFCTQLMGRHGKAVRTRYWKDDHYEMGGARSW